jgi:hypothetical protein
LAVIGARAYAQEEGGPQGRECRNRIRDARHNRWLSQKVSDSSWLPAGSGSRFQAASASRAQGNQRRCGDKNGQAAGFTYNRNEHFMGTLSLDEFSKESPPGSGGAETRYPFPTITSASINSNESPGSFRTSETKWPLPESMSPGFTVVCSSTVSVTQQQFARKTR